jgi:hypothetical protein
LHHPRNRDSNRGTDRRNDPYARARRRRSRERRDASSGWRAEYADQGVPIPDGGEDTLPSPGDRARDRDADDDAEVLVLRTHGSSRADNWHIPALDGKTVYQVNQEYPPWSPVVEAVYLDELEATLDGWRGVEDVRDAVSLDALRSYAFPAARLAPPDRPEDERRVDTGALLEGGDGT